jgi:hypothetical protein
MMSNLMEVCRDEVAMLSFDVLRDMLCERHRCPAVPVSEVLQTQGEKQTPRVQPAMRSVVLPLLS